MARPVGEALPFLVGALLAVLSVLPFKLAGGGIVMPFLSFAAFFYWRLMRPDLMSVFSGFILGLIQDIVSGAPLGLHALVYVLAAGVMNMRSFAPLRDSFKLMWRSFITMTVGLGVVIWLLYNLLSPHYVGPEGYAVQVLVTCFMFPLLAWFFGFMHRHVAALSDDAS